MNWDFTSYNLSLHIEFVANQISVETYNSLALGALQRTTHSGYLKSKDTITSAFTFAIGVQKDSNFLQNFRAWQNTV